MIVLTAISMRHPVRHRRLQGNGAMSGMSVGGGANVFSTKLFTHAGTGGHSAAASAIHRLIESAPRHAQ